MSKDERKLKKREQGLSGNAIADSEIGVGTGGEKNEIAALATDQKPQVADEDL